jgi:Na+-translocating ferredoxin:NAD+ oxidoreductase RnfG subunit
LEKDSEKKEFEKINLEKENEKINLEKEKEQKQTGPIKKFFNTIFDKFDGKVQQNEKKAINKEELKAKKKQIKEILKDQNFTGKEIKSALTVSKLNMDKAIILLLDMN